MPNRDSQNLSPEKSKGGGRLFLISLPICALVALGGILDPVGMASGAGLILSTVFRALDWFFMATVTTFLILVL